MQGHISSSCLAESLSSKWLNHQKKIASLKNHQGSCWSYFISACSNQTRVPLGVSFTLFLLRKHLITPLGCVPEFAEAMTASMHKLSLGDSFWSLELQCFISGIIRADWTPRLPTGWPVFSLRVVQSCIIGPRGDLFGEVVSCTLWVVLFSPSTCWKPNLKILPVFFKPTCKSLIESHLQNISQVSGLCVWGPVSSVRAHPNPGLPRETGAILKAQQWAQAHLSIWMAVDKHQARGGAVLLAWGLGCTVLHPKI